MHSHPETRTFSSPEDIFDVVIAQCAVHGPVRSVSLFCRSEQPQQLLCMLQMERGAQTAAASFPRAFVTGDDVCTFVAVAAQFCCARRTDGHMAVATCNDCRRRG